MWNVASDRFRKLATKQRESLHKWTMIFFSKLCPSLYIFITLVGFHKGPPENKKCKQGDYNVNSKISLQHLDLQFYPFVFNSKV